MPTASDKSNARELTRMVTRYANSHETWGSVAERAGTVAERAGISGIRWIAYDTGQSTMTLPVLCAVARVLGLSLGQLISKSEARYRG